MYVNHQSEKVLFLLKITQEAVKCKLQEFCIVEKVS